MSHRRSRHTLTVAVLALVAAFVSPAVAGAAPTYGQVRDAQPRHFEPRVAKGGCTPSGQSGGSVDQATVLARAQAWVDQNVAYTQTCGHDPGGYYREDCSGFVSMTWELTQSLSSWDFNPAYNGGNPLFQQIPQDALVPGDAVVADNSTADHIALFTGWGSNDHGLHRYANLSEESDFGVGTIAVTNQDLDGSYWGRFTPIHYAKLTLPGPVQSSGSAVFSPDDLSYRLFWTGSGGHLMQTSYLAGTWQTQDMGGVIAGEPAVTYNAGRYDVFAVSPGGHLFQRTYVGGTWRAWVNLGDSWTPGVSAVYLPTSSTFYVFGHGPSGHVQVGYWSDYWSGPWQRQDLGGITTGVPGVSYQNGHFDVFAVSPGQRLFHAAYTDGVGGSWHRLGTATYQPGATAIATTTGHRVFLRSTANRMAQVYDDAAGWHGPQDLGGSFDRAPGVTYHGGRYDLFSPTATGIYQATYIGSWSSWHKLPS
jgi:hypothetical protein